MIPQQDVDRLAGMDAVGPDGEKVGSIDVPYVDDETGEPTFALVNTGLFGMKSSFVPLHDASIQGDQVQVAYDKDRVKDAPRMDADGDLTPDEEQELYRYYGLDQGDATTGADTTGGAGTTGATTGQDNSGRGGGDAMTRSEEEMHVGTQRREAGKARLRKHVVTEHVTKTVPVQREEVHVEREPITDENRDAAIDGPDLTEDEHEVTLTEEEPVVEKRTVPKERVRLDKETHTDQEQVGDDVAREEIDLTDPEGAERR